MGLNKWAIRPLSCPAKPLKKDNRYQRDKKRKLCKWRATIEPIIGHLKSDFRLSRNRLKGQIGDEINALMVASAWNLRKWLFFVTSAIYGLKKRVFVRFLVKIFDLFDSRLIHVR